MAIQRFASHIYRAMLPALPPRHRFRLVAIVAVLAALVCLSRSSLAQQPARTDTTPLRADYRDLAELMQKLPNIAAPAFDESRALWLGALPLACVDRL